MRNLTTWMPFCITIWLKPHEFRFTVERWSRNINEKTFHRYDYGFWIYAGRMMFRFEHRLRGV